MTSITLATLVHERHLDRLGKIYNVYAGFSLRESYRTYSTTVVGGPCLKTTYYYASEKLVGTYDEVCIWTQEAEDATVENPDDTSTSYDNRIRTIPFDDTKNGIETIVTSVGTTATQIEVPEGVKEYTIFHQTVENYIHWGADNTVSTSDPILKMDDVLEISGSKNFEIWMKTSSGTVEVFVLATVKV